MSGLSLLCRAQQDRPHAPCSGTTDDGTDSPCMCRCHLDDLLGRFLDLYVDLYVDERDPPGPVGPVDLAKAPPLRPESIALTWTAHGVLCALAWHPRRQGLNGYVHAPNMPGDWATLPVVVHGGLTWGRDGWIGFDTAHIGDWWPQWPSTDPLDIAERSTAWIVDRVVAETEALAAQVAAADEWP